MKIDFVISNLSADGAQRVVSTLANFLVNNGNDVRIITYKEGDRYELDEKVKRIRLHKKLPLFDSNLIRGFWNLSKFYRKKKNRPDIISSHIHSMGMVTIPLSLFYGVKLVVSEHNNHVAKKMNLQKWFLWNVLYRFPAAVTILTSFDKAYFEDKNKNVVVMPNPLSFERNFHLTERNNKIIVAAGNLNRYHHKGFDNLMDIVALVVEKHTDWKFMLVGEGQDGLSLLKKKAEHHGIIDNLIFAGYRNDIKKILEDSEIFVLTSRYEGLPMVLMEAASQGIACIAYDCISGPSEIIENELTGILIENQNKGAMAKGLIRLIEDKNLRTELGKNAVDHVDKFSLDRIGRKWEVLLNKIVSN